MAINLKCIQRINPQDRTGEQKWYPIQKRAELIDESTVAELIAEDTTLNAAEALMAIRRLRKIVVQQVLNGNSVKLGDWGSFSITLTTTPADTKAELTADNITKVNLRFSAGTEVKTALKAAKFVWMNKDDDTETEETTTETE